MQERVYRRADHGARVRRVPRNQAETIVVSRCSLHHVHAWERGVPAAEIDGAALVAELLSPAGARWRRRRQVAMHRRGEVQS